jgi:hypothetical protein
MKKKNCFHDEIILLDWNVGVELMDIFLTSGAGVVVEEV